ncbi:MAG: glycosyltransferase family 4 protein [bacterium]
MELFLLRLNKEIVQNGWSHILVLEPPVPYWFRNEIEKDGGSIVLFSFPLRFTSAVSLLRILIKHQPDVLHAHFISPFNPWIHLIKKISPGCCLIYTDHSSGNIRKKSAISEYISFVRGKLASMSFNRLIAVSDYVAERDIKQAHLSGRKVIRIYNGNGIDIESRFPVRSSEDEDYRESGPVRVTFVGRLIRKKGVMTLLRAFKQVRQTVTIPVELVIAGKGPMESELRSYCSKEGLTDVEFPGYVSDIADLFSRADIVVVPSEWDEAFGFTVVEGMAAGAAVLGSDAGGIPEILGCRPEAGLVFKRGNEGDLACKLRQLVENPSLRQALGRSARERVEAFFTLDSMVRGYLEVYRNVLLSNQI